MVPAGLGNDESLHLPSNPPRAHCSKPPFTYTIYASVTGVVTGRNQTWWNLYNLGINKGRKADWLSAVGAAGIIPPTSLSRKQDVRSRTAGQDLLVIINTNSISRGWNKTKP